MGTSSRLDHAANILRLKRKRTSLLASDVYGAVIVKIEMAALFPVVEEGVTEAGEKEQIAPIGSPAEQASETEFKKGPEDEEATVTV
jgi:hypothetical protein